MIGHYLSNNNENATVPILPKKFGTKLGRSQEIASRIFSYSRHRQEIIAPRAHVFDMAGPAWLQTTRRRPSLIRLRCPHLGMCCNTCINRSTLHRSSIIKQVDNILILVEIKKN
jgi:hypothetical protein